MLGGSLERNVFLGEHPPNRVGQVRWPRWANGRLAQSATYRREKWRMENGEWRKWKIENEKWKMGGEETLSLGALPSFFSALSASLRS